MFFVWVVGVAEIVVDRDGFDDASDGFGAECGDTIARVDFEGRPCATLSAGARLTAHPLDCRCKIAAIAFLRCSLIIIIKW
jgi:hypothetical protein